jgi:hypothetical protein
MERNRTITVTYVSLLRKIFLTLPINADNDYVLLIKEEMLLNEKMYKRTDKG